MEVYFLAGSKTSSPLHVRMMVSYVLVSESSTQQKFHRNEQFVHVSRSASLLKTCFFEWSGSVPCTLNLIKGDFSASSYQSGDIRCVAGMYPSTFGSSFSVRSAYTKTLHQTDTVSALRQLGSMQNAIAADTGDHVEAASQIEAFKCLKVGEYFMKASPRAMSEATRMHACIGGGSSTLSECTF